MKKGVQKLWAELASAKKPAKLSKQGKEVKLSLVDDATEIYDELKDYLAELQYFNEDVLPDLEDKMSEIYRTVDEYFINGSMRYVPEYSDNLIEALDKIEKSAKDLGIDPEDIFSNFNNALDLHNDANSYVDEARREYENSRVSRASNFDIPL